MTDLNTNYFLDVRVDNIDRITAHKLVRDFIITANGDGPRKIYFTNVHSIHLATRDRVLKKYINNADVVLPDGSGLKIAGSLLRKPIRENLNGTDFTPEVCEMAQESGWSVFLFGASDDVVHKCRQKLLERLPGLAIVGSQHGYITSDEDVINKINNSNADILLVALGSPRQEKWIAENAGRLNVRICFAVGGLFDFLSGEKKRAPNWMRKSGIEWLHRFIVSPRQKWRRIFFEIPWFLFRILIQWSKLLSPYTHPANNGARYE